MESTKLVQDISSFKKESVKKCHACKIMVKYYCPIGVDAICNDFDRVVHKRMKNRRDEKDLEIHRTCCICMINSKSVVFLPCKHMATCVTCFEELVIRSFPRYPSCPICRSQILHTIKVHT